MNKYPNIFDDTISNNINLKNNTNYSKSLNELFQFMNLNKIINQYADDYLLGDEYYITETSLSQGGRDGNGLVVIEVIEIGATKYLARDAEGIKGWNGITSSNGAWAVVGSVATESLFIEYGVDSLPQSVNDLLDNAKLLVWTDNPRILEDLANYRLNLTANVSPRSQTITQITPFEMPPKVDISSVALVTDMQNGGSVSYEYAVGEDGICFTYTLEKPNSAAIAGIKKTNIYFTEVIT